MRTNFEINRYNIDEFRKHANIVCFILRHVTPKRYAVRHSGTSDRYFHQEHFAASAASQFRIYLKWPEMRSKVNFGHPKWPTAAILSKISKKNKVTYRSEMARNAIESEFWTSKMADGSHFVKKFQK